jgi:hypothetical protein
MKSVFTLVGIFTVLFANGQANNDTIKVIANLISPIEGSKIHIAEYKIIKVIKGVLTNDTIKVGYYGWNQNETAPDTALLTLTTYTGGTKTKDYYIFPEYNARKGIESVRISTVNFDYWEGCETGKSDCKPLKFVRTKKDENLFLFMPCGGTQTSVTLSASGKEEPIQKLRIVSSECPPVFDLTNLMDGKYFAYMLACGLGGQIEVNLITIKD